MLKYFDVRLFLWYLISIVWPRCHTAAGFVAEFRNLNLPVVKIVGQGPGHSGGLHSFRLYGGGYCRLKCASAIAASSSIVQSAKRFEGDIMLSRGW